MVEVDWFIKGDPRVDFGRWRRNRRKIRDRYDIWHTVCMNNLSFKTYVLAVFFFFVFLFLFDILDTLILLDFFQREGLVLQFYFSISLFL